MSTDEPKELIARIAARDERAFERFVELYANDLLRVCRWWTSSDADAEDALQQSFVAIWRHGASYNGTGSPRAWALSIARKAALRTHRRRRGEPARNESFEELGLAAGWADPSLAQNQERSLANRERLRHALHGLPLEEQEILVLRDVEGLSTKEAAQACGISETAVKGRLHRGRLRLMAELKELER